MERSCASSPASNRAPIRILVFSSLYPNVCEPRHGIFVEQRLRQLVKSGEVAAQVVAPVPWFPFKTSRFGRYGMYGAVPRSESRHNIRVLHPRFPSIPGIGMNLKPHILMQSMRRILRNIVAQGYRFDAIDAHYFYPDGVAAVWLGRVLQKPVVVTCRGDDVLHFSQYSRPRRMMLDAAMQAAGLVTVSAELKQRLCLLGVPAERISVLRNGVDTSLFSPVDRAKARQALGVKRRTLLSVGHLVERKGHHLVVAALKELPDYDLVIIGERGSEAAGMVGALHQQIESLGLTNRVRIVGNMAQEQLRKWYGAADALVLATSREGMPNVVLESLACGTPVIATPAGGIPEILTTPDAGLLMKERTPEAVVTAVRQLFNQYPSRERTRQFAETLDWEATTQGQLALFRKITGDCVRSPLGAGLATAGAAGKSLASS